MSQYPQGPSGLPGDIEPPPLPPVAQPYVPQYIAYSPSAIFPYESAGPWARVVIGLLWVSVVLQLLLVWPYLSDLSDRRAARAGTEVSDELTTTMIAIGVMGLVYLVVHIVLVVFWMMWVHRTYRNLRPLGAEGLAYSPAWAVGYNFIPIVNLFRPYQVMRETWRASDPRHAGGTHWMTIAVPARIGVWWAMYLLSTLAALISVWVGVTSEDRNVLYAIAWLDLFLLFWGVALARVEMRLVRSLTDLQDARASAFEMTSYGGRPDAHGAAAGGYPPGFHTEPGTIQVAQPYASSPGPASPPPPEPWSPPRAG